MVVRNAETTASAAMPKVAGARILILEAPYYAKITNALAEGALAAITGAGATAERLAVPGALELPQALSALVEANRIGQFAGDRKKWDGVVVLGCVIRGETTHYETVCDNSNHWLMQVALQHGVPLGNALLTVNTEAQAWERADPAKANCGGGAAVACLRLIEIKRQFGA